MKRISKKRLGFGIFILLIVGTVYLFCRRDFFRARDEPLTPLRKNDLYFLPLKIDGFSTGNIPYLQVDLENGTVTAKIDLGYEGHIALPSRFMKDLKRKKFIKRKKSYGLKGRTRESDVYELEKMMIGTVSFYPVLADEVGLELNLDTVLGPEEGRTETGLARVGWRLFQNLNLLVDYKNLTIALCDGPETLRKQGYSVDLFTKVPLLLDRGLIEFEAQTEQGPLRCMLDTGCTRNLLNKDFGDPSNGHMIFTPDNVDEYVKINPDNQDMLNLHGVEEMPVFTVGGKEFGPVSWTRIRSPMAVEAILGMEFFEKTLVFIDFSDRKVYFSQYPETEEKSSAEVS